MSLTAWISWLVLFFIFYYHILSFILPSNILFFSFFLFQRVKLLRVSPLRFLRIRQRRIQRSLHSWKDRNLKMKIFFFILFFFCFCLINYQVERQTDFQEQTINRWWPEITFIILSNFEFSVCLAHKIKYKNFYLHFDWVKVEPSLSAQKWFDINTSTY